jgi:hypothetical protein
MDLPDLTGPFKLTASNISINIRRGTVGAYVLGPLQPDGRLTVRCTGRSERDMAADLRGRIEKYEAFGYIRADSPESALALECVLYHHFEPADNATHPARGPEDSEWTCPVCGASKN